MITISRKFGFIQQVWVEEEKFMRKNGTVSEEIPTEFVSHKADAVAGAQWVDNDYLHIVNGNKDIVKTPVHWID